MLAIIGGSGLTKLSTLNIVRREVVRTPYGEPSGALIFGRMEEFPVVFLARHGYGHTIPPHQVNYQANIWALKQAGASAILSVASVGGIRADLKPGVLIVPDQIIDYTWGRKSTYFEKDDMQVRHVDFTHPYDQSVRKLIFDAAEKAGEKVLDSGVYAVTQGPRLETIAEINRLERDGADMVGMTAMPEAGLARELELPYAAISVVSNYAAGRGGNTAHVSFDGIESALQDAMKRVYRILERIG